MHIENNLDFNLNLLKKNYSSLLILLCLSIFIRKSHSYEYKSDLLEMWVESNSNFNVNELNKTKERKLY